MPDVEATHAPDRTFVAAITPIGAAGIAVIRLVGPDASRIAQAVFEPSGQGPQATRIEPGRIAYGRIVDGAQVIDDVVMTTRPLTEGRGDPQGDLVEINPHGGVRVVQRVLMLLVRHGASLTDAHEIGLLGWPAHDKIEREVWASLTRAQTQRAAMWLAHQQTVLRETIRRCIEALSSPDPPDVAVVVDELARLRSGYEPARRLIEGAGIAITGPPNAGKSTLANRLFGQPRSLVAEQPGTTRDWVAEPAAVEGVPIMLADTAGLRATEDPIEQASIERGLGRVASADLALLVLDRSRAMTSSDRCALEALERSRPADRTLLVLNKCDLPDALGRDAEHHAAWADDVTVSALTGEGVDRLGRAIVSALGLGDWSDRTPALWTPRQRAAVDEALAFLPGRPAHAAKALHRLPEM